MNSKDVTKIIVEWLKKKNEEAYTKGFVVGVSGGIDSAVTSALCAMTGENVLAINMPIQSESGPACNHLLWLEGKFSNVIWQHVDLTNAFIALEKLMRWNRNDIVWVNVRSRLRMIALYAHANNYNMLVTGTGNKVEDFGMGFFTKYGDGGVDISPIGDLMKSEVYKLGRHLGVSEEILNAAPTDGLWEDGRTDEDQFGATYDELEWAMNFEGSLGTLNERQREVMTIYLNRHNLNSHKMKPIPVCRINENKMNRK